MMTRTPRHLRAAALGGSVALLVAVAWATLSLRRGRSSGACCPGAGAAALDQPIASELDYAVDSLPNGLRFYVRAHPSGSDRTELRLVVDAGSVQEAEDQHGLAHAVEHMVFGGTRSFPGGAIERYFEAIGMRRGDDVNATTSLDDTQYRMTVPTTRAGAIDTALAMLASIAHEATFDAADARREAGVLLEEWRSSRDAAARVEEAQHPLLYAGTAYATRPTIGDTGVLRRFDVGAMRRFYETWYRPELMAVVVVGDFDAEEVEAMVRRHFASLPRRGALRPRPTPPEAVPPPAALRASVVADREAWSSWIGIWSPGHRQRYRTRADYRAGMIASLWRDMLRARLEDAVLEADSPLAGVDVERRALARAISAEVVSVSAMKGRTLEALDAAVAEMKELARSGPTPEELEERVRATLRRTREQAQSSDESAALAAEFVDHFLTGNAVLTSRVADELARDILPTVTAKDVRTFARARTTDSGAVVVVAATADDEAGRGRHDRRAGPGGAGAHGRLARGSARRAPAPRERRRSGPDRGRAGHPRGARLRVDALERHARPPQAHLVRVRRDPNPRGRSRRGLPRPRRHVRVGVLRRRDHRRDGGRAYPRPAAAALARVDIDLARTHRV